MRKIVTRINLFFSCKKRNNYSAFKCRKCAKVLSSTCTIGLPDNRLQINQITRGIDKAIAN